MPTATIPKKPDSPYIRQQLKKGGTLVYDEERHGWNIRFTRSSPSTTPAMSQTATPPSARPEPAPQPWFGSLEERRLKSVVNNLANATLSRQQLAARLQQLCCGPSCPWWASAVSPHLQRRATHSAPIAAFYANVYRTPSDVRWTGERLAFAPGAFDDVLARIKQNGLPLTARVEHKEELTFASRGFSQLHLAAGPLEVFGDELGLVAVAALPANRLGRAVAAAIRCGQLCGASISYGSAGDFETFTNGWQPYRAIGSVATLTEVSLCFSPGIGNTVAVLLGEPLPREPMYPDADTRWLAQQAGKVAP
jgi:phage head maturation protease